MGGCTLMERQTGPNQLAPSTSPMLGSRGSRVSDFFTKNPNQEKIQGEGGGPEARESDFFYKESKLKFFVCVCGGGGD